MDYGPFMSYSVNSGLAGGETNITLKGIVIKLRNKASACFDTDTLRFSAVWKSTSLDISKTHLTSYKGSDHAFSPQPALLVTVPGPGWAKDNSFSDPRPLRTGPLPRPWGQYRGLFRHGDTIVLSYTVGAAEVLEIPGFEEMSGADVFTRTFRIEPGSSSQSLRLCHLESASALKMEPDYCELRDGSRRVTTSVTGLPEGAKLEMTPGSGLDLKLPPLTKATLFKVSLAISPSTNEHFPGKDEFQKQAAIQDPATFRGGGPARWPDAISTVGRKGPDRGAYVVDHLTVPEQNPWRSWMRLTALDFFSDGRAAVTTWNGDVWIVSGIDSALKQISWKRHASGLYEPLGLKIVHDALYVLGRDQITRLKDLNADGEADHYENFNNDGFLASSYHAFALDLQTDRAGNFYYTRCGQRAPSELPMNGGMLQVSPDGQRTTLYATGLRAANGLAIGPNDEITCSDNQGNWIPSSRLNWVKRGGFYGYVPHAGPGPVPTDYDPPLCWLPVTIDNSSGGQVWAPARDWGPLSGQLLHTSYGSCSLFLVLFEQVLGQHQGGVVRLPLQFDSGIMRGRFHPLDGQLYLAGLKGWTTRAVRDGALERVRYTGRPFHLPVGLRVRPQGIEIAFNCQLDAESASDLQNYAVEQWNYRWSAEYGSRDFSALHPGEVGRDQVEIQSVEVLKQEKVFLKMAGLRPVMQMKIQFRLRALDGSPVTAEVYNTINRIPLE